MAETLYISQGNNNIWTAALILEIQAFPAKLQDDSFLRLMNTCHQLGISIETVAASHGEKRGKVQTYLILRKSGLSPSYLSEKLQKYLEILSERMNYAGFRYRVLSQEEAGDFSWKLTNRKIVLLCIPGENLRHSQNIYIPGGYDAVVPLDIPYLMNLISRYSDSGISLQAVPTTFSPQESDIIAQNENWARQQGTIPEMKKAADIFAWYHRMENRSKFCLCITIWGSEESLNHMTSNLHSGGFAMMDVPRDWLYQKDYLILGELLVEDMAIQSGHTYPEHIAMPVGCERLNYITIPEVVNELVSAVYHQGGIPGIEMTVSGGGKTALPEVYTDPSGLEAGKVVNTESTVYLPLNSLGKHMVAAGMPGSGKTMFLFQMMKELSKKGIPFLAIEPTKTEYRELLDIIPNLRVLTPGRSDVSPIMFNLFLPPKNVTLEQFLPSLEAAFLMAFSMKTPLDVILKDVLQSCYAKYGWRSTSTRDSEGVTVFGMQEFIRVFKKHIRNSGYDGESKGNLLSGGGYRLESILNSNRYLFDTDKSLDVESLLQGNTVIELDAIDHPEQKALFLTMLLLQLKLVIRKNQQADSRLKNVILIDEAHILLNPSKKMMEKGDADPSGALVDYLLDMVKVNRAYGTGMIFADQSLAMMKDFVDNAGTKLAFHLESMEDRRYLAENLQLPAYIRDNMASLPVGRCYLAGEQMEVPICMQIPNVREELAIPTYVSDQQVKERMHVICEKPFCGCPCKKSCDLEIRTEAEFIARRICDKLSGMMNDKEALKQYMDRVLQDVIESQIQDDENEKRIMKCARFMTERLIYLKATCLDD